MCYNNHMQKIFDLDNGLKLVYAQNRAVRSVALGVFVRAGSIYETPDQSGISHFIEHMMFKGTKRRTAFDIVNETDCIGAQINAFTSKSYTCYYTVSVDTNVKKCADILSDMFFNSTFDAVELERERRVVLEEINESEDTPDDLCLEKLSSVFYKGHTLEKPILGNVETLKSMTSESLKKYVADFYTASNTVISIAGNISEKDALSIAEKYFNLHFTASGVKRETIETAALKGGFIKEKKEIEQSHMAFAFPSLAFENEKSVAVQLFASIFGTEMSSRLFQSVRERLGLCYTVMGYPSSYENNGMFVIYTSTSSSNALKAAAAIRDEIDLLIEKGISDEELAKGKEQLKTALVLGQESTSSMMKAFGRYAVQTGELYNFDLRIKQIDAITKSDVAEVAAFIFNFDKVAASLVSKDVNSDIFKAIKKI